MSFIDGLGICAVCGDTNGPWDYIRGDGCVIAVLRGSKMKKVIVKASVAMKQKELKELAVSLKKQWDEGLMVIPSCFKVKVVDE